MSKKDQLKSILRDKYFAQNPDAALRDILETQQLVPLIEKFMEKMQFITPTLGTDYFTESEKEMFYSALYNELKANIKDGEQGLRGEKGDTGVQGIRGEAGKTPVRGVDYFTKEDVAVFTAMIMSKLPNIEKLIQARIDEATGGVQDMVMGHIDAAKKDIPTGDSVVSQILNHPLLRVLLHGGGGSTSTGGTTTFYQQTPVGAVDGANKIYTTANPTNTIISLIYNGENIHPGEYTKNASGFTMATALPVIPGAAFTITYV